MSYYTTPRRRMYCERLADGKWNAVRHNGVIAFRDEELNTFNANDELYNIGIVWAECQSEVLGDELKEVLSGKTVTTMRFGELNLFINRSIEGMYRAVMLEAIRNTQSSHEDLASRVAFEMALESYAELKMVERDVLDIIGDRPEYIDYADIRIIWAEQE